MGSKRTIAGKVYRAIKNREKEANILVDIFAGGFAISEYFIKQGWSVTSNDKNKYVVELAREAINGRFNDDNFSPEFITREKFFDVIKNPDNFDDWYVGYIQCIWSFGNTQNRYLFGKEIEPIKRAGHLLVVNKDPKQIKEMNILPEFYIKKILMQDNWHKRRMALRAISASLNKNRNYQDLQRLERLERLELSSLDYRDVKIPGTAIIYCDPPYEDTGGYSVGKFNHDEFWQWCRDISKTNKIYISSYKCPDDFVSILEFDHRKTIGTSFGNNGKSREALFIPKGQK